MCTQTAIPYTVPCVVCQALLGYDLRKGSLHNCLDDARAAMKLVLARLEGKIDDIVAEEVTSIGIHSFLKHFNHDMHSDAFYFR